MMNPVPWLQMTNMISYQGLVRTFPKVKATCDTGDLKFREATEYAAGKHDDSRVRAIHYLDNVFESDCRMAMKDKKLFSVVYVNEKIDVVKLSYDLAIRGESSRVGSVVK
ncbi:hypothetical protein HV139_10750 [Citrobacter freundii]|nr:hypothetical protein [Citrobacter freundii]QLW72569.1 hypothetical protein HV139_10750 [Citrobacter freundii]